MIYHKFGEIEGPADDTTKQYKRCQICRKVMFIQDDEHFNLVCMGGVISREELRKELEAK